MPSAAKIKGFLLLMVIFLPVSTATAGQDNDDLHKLLARQKVLKSRIEKLRHEQDFLLFQKSAYETDSKYVVVDLREKTGQIKYKSRVLRDFPLFFSHSSVKRIRQGAVTLTGKIDGPGQQRRLVFGTSLILEDTGPPGNAKRSPPRISLAKKDLTSVLRAMEKGGRAYLIRSR